jgi:hypothetical protein
MTGRFARVPIRAAGLTDLRERDYRVLIAIAAHADAEGRAYPSMTTISVATGIARGDVPRMLRHLEQLGLLRRDRRSEAHGGAASTIYTIVFENTGGVSAGADTVSAQLRTGVPAQQQVGCLLTSTRGVSAGADLTNKNRPSNKRRRIVRPYANQSVADLEFETFWRIFPKRGPHTNPKHPAREQYLAALNRGTDPKEINRGAENYAAAMARTATLARYIKQARYWLKDRLWEQYADLDSQPDLPLAAGMI